MIPVYHISDYKSDFTVQNRHFGSKKIIQSNRYLLFVLTCTVPQKEGGYVVNLPVRAPLASHLVQLVEDVLAELGFLFWKVFNSVYLMGRTFSNGKIRDSLAIRFLP